MDHEGEDARDRPLERTYRALTPPAARLFRLLGLHPTHRFGAAAASALTGGPPGEVPVLVGELADAGLIVGFDQDRYLMSEAARMFAAARAAVEEGGAECRAAVRRLLDHYLAVAASDDPEAREAEHDNLRACVLTAEEYGLDEPVWRLSEALWPLSARLGHPPEWIRVLGAGVEAAQRLDDRRAEGSTRRRLASALLALDRLDDAEVQLDAAVAAAREAGDRRGVAATVESLGLLRLRQGRPADAVELLGAAGGLHLDAGRPGEAVGPLDRALAIAGEACGPARTADLAVLRARCAGESGAPADEERFLRMALDGYERAGSPVAEDIGRRLRKPPR
ncbi:tetratricopeptide repeat protein [Wenjunlia tyrosinilytica]|uniref:Tetratricopeptide repeat protein n=1 Tax=Wenjunlia tyrosinilytica TaxID=1544741 RepID=A0A917ZSH2_9ACTN|nr:tetratricopeptide repeat protein [Wenjunlia tyrosinilytica]GGO91021.1 hypothetical protein GCM10012280_37930 [Wenjunlia tyrosinilytica]